MPKKQTFLSDAEKTPSGAKKRHLRIIITDPDNDQNQVIVSVTTLRYPSQDKSCVLLPGEHPFIKEKSIVDFKRTTVMSYIQIFNGIQKGLLIRKEDISDELLKRIQKAATKSKYISDEIKSMCVYF